MPISKSELKSQVVSAIRMAARDWKDMQVDVLRRAVGEHPQFSTMPPWFRAAGWLNMGLDATPVLFPGSVVAKAIARVSVPLTVADLAMKGFQKVYANEVNRVNTVMSGDFGSVRRKFESEIKDAADALGATPFGQKAEQLVVSILERRLNDFESRAMAYFHVKSMLEHERFGIIETSESEITKRTQAGFVPLLEKIKTVYQATWAPGRGVLWRVDPSRQSCYRNILGHERRLYDPIRGEVVHCGSRQWWVAYGNMKDRPGIAEILSNIWRYEVQIHDGWHTDTAWVWPAAQPLPVAHKLVSSFEKQGLEDFKASLEQADREQWSTTQRYVRGAA